MCEGYIIVFQFDININKFGSSMSVIRVCYGFSSYTEKNDILKITVICIVTSGHACNVKIITIFYSKNSCV